MKKIYAVLLFIAYSALACTAQSGALDTTFNPWDKGIVNGTDDEVNTTAIQPDGKIIIAGYFTKYKGAARNHIARLNPDGALDLTFNPGSGTGGTGSQTTIYTSALQNDGKIIVAGDFVSYGGTARRNVARINANGTLDVSFNSGTLIGYTVESAAIQADGKILLGGTFGARVIRLNPDGSKDSTFKTGTGPDNAVMAVAVQKDGKIMIGGGFTAYNGIPIVRIARLNTDGSLDSTFKAGSGPNSDVNSIAIQTDGKIIISGAFFTYNGMNRNYSARLNTDGSLDLTFDPGTQANSTVFTSAIQADGKAVLAGNGISRRDTTGSADLTFKPGSGPNARISSVAMQNDGKIIIGGLFSLYNGIPIFAIARLNPNGSLDTTFNRSTGASDQVLCSAIQTDGKIIIGGGFTAYNGIPAGRIARLNPDGSLDTTFHAGPGADSQINSISIQNDGKIIVTGAFTSYNGLSKNNIMRINPDGSPDPGFSFGFPPYTSVYTTAIQPDGKILIGGGFNLIYSGRTRYGIVRIHPDGTIDTTFKPDISSSVYTLSVQKDGKVIFGGDGLGRFNTDGSMDAGFLASGTNVFASAIQPDGKIILGGQFTQFNGKSKNNIVRCNADGSLDTTFITGTGANGTVRALALQTDGKIIIADGFTSYNGTARNCIARLNTNGTLDFSFTPGTGPANSSYYSPGLNTVSIQKDGKIIIGGLFTSYNNSGKNYVARLLNSVAPVVTTFTCNTTTVCRGNVVAFTDQSTGSPASWKWSFPGGSPSSSALQNPVVMYNAPGTYNVKLVNLSSNDSLIRTGYITVTACAQAPDCWTGIGSGINGSVHSLAADTVNNILYAGGDFYMAGGNAANSIAKWNGSSWSALGSGMDSRVDALVMNQGALYAGGLFTQAGGVSCNYVAEWNGSSWSPLGSGTNSYIRALCVHNGEVYAGGPGGVAKWNGSSWTYISTSDINAFALYSYKGELYAGGAFDGSSVPSNYITKWNGVSWLPVGNIPYDYNNEVLSFAEYNGDLYLGGIFNSIGNSPANNIARWDGSKLLPAGAGFKLAVFALTNFNGDLYAGGMFDSVGGIPADYIATWNGANWYSVGGGTDLTLYALTQYNKGLIAGGAFSKAGSASAKAVASYPCGFNAVESYGAAEADAGAFPNPSDGSFTIRSNREISAIRIVNLMGEEIPVRLNTPQVTSFPVDLRNYPGGIYFYRLTLKDGEITTGKIVLR